MLADFPPPSTKVRPADPVQLAEYFSRFGEVIESKIVYSHENMKSRGFGFVVFRAEESVDHVLNEYNNHQLHGRWIECKPAMLKQELSKQPTQEPVSANPKPSNRPSDNSTANCKQKPGAKIKNKLQQKNQDIPPTKTLTQQKISPKNKPALKEPQDSSVQGAGQPNEPSRPNDAHRSPELRPLLNAKPSSGQEIIYGPKKPSETNKNKNQSASGRRKPATNKKKPSKRCIDSAKSRLAAEEDPAMRQHPANHDIFDDLAPRSYPEESESDFSHASHHHHFEETEYSKNPVTLESREMVSLQSAVFDQQMAYWNRGPATCYPPQPQLPTHSSQQRFDPRLQFGSFAQAPLGSSAHPRASYAERQSFEQPPMSLQRGGNQRQLGIHGSLHQGSQQIDQEFEFGSRLYRGSEELDGDHFSPEATSNMDELSRCGQSGQGMREIDSFGQHVYYPRNDPPISFDTREDQDADLYHYDRRWQTRPSAYHQSPDFFQFQYQDVYVDASDDWLGNQTLDCPDHLHSAVDFHQVQDSREYLAFPTTQTDSQFSAVDQGILSQDQWEEVPLSQRYLAVNPQEPPYDQKARLFNSRTRDESELMIPDKSRGSFRASGNVM